MTRWHITLDTPTTTLDPWRLLGYLTDCYGLAESVADNEDGITVTIVDAAGYEHVDTDTAALGRTFKALGDGEAIANEIAQHDQSRYWGAIELIAAIYEDAGIDRP